MPRRILEGKVVSDKQDKTVTVLVERRFMHPIYKKYLKKSKKFAAHDEANACKEGETIQIIECRPISKNKRWTVYTGQETDGLMQAAKPAAAPKAAAPKKEEADKEAAPKKTAEKKEPAKKPAAKKTTAKKK